MPELETNEDRQNAINSGHETLGSLIQGPRFRDGLVRVLPAGMDAGRFYAIVQRQMSAVENLAACTPRSVLGSMTMAASLGLEPGINGECYLIPYNLSKQDAAGNWYKELTCSLQIGYLGHLAMAWRSEKIAAVQVNYVMRGDHFAHQNGTSGFLEHIPKDDRGTSGKDMTHAYGLVETTMGGKIWWVLSRSDVERIRNSSPSKNSPAWNDWYVEMAMSKALKRCLKYAPKTREMASAISVDDAHEAGLNQNFDVPQDILPAETQSSERHAQAQNLMDQVQKKHRQPGAPDDAEITVEAERAPPERETVLAAASRQQARQNATDATEAAQAQEPPPPPPPPPPRERAWEARLVGR